MDHQKSDGVLELFHLAVCLFSHSPCLCRILYMGANPLHNGFILGGGGTGVVRRFFSRRFHPKSRRLFPFYFSNITLRTFQLIFGVTGAAFKIAGEMRRLPAYFDNPWGGGGGGVGIEGGILYCCNLNLHTHLIWMPGTVQPSNFSLSQLFSFPAKIIFTQGRTWPKCYCQKWGCIAFLVLCLGKYLFFFYSLPM